MINVEEVTKDEWKALEIIKGHSLSSVIAGGYMRDTLLNVPFNDIDVFIHKRYCKELTKFLVAAGFDIRADVERNYDDVMFESCRVEGTRLNVIFIEGEITPTQFVERHFDIGICQAVYNLTTEHLHTTPRFDYDFEHNKVTIIHQNISKRAGNSQSKSEGRAHRICSKLNRYTRKKWQVIGDSANVPF
jgi:hypothetical protein